MEFKPFLKSFAEEVGFVKFQIDSFNDFIDRRLQRIIDSIGEIKPEVPEIGDLTIKLGKVTVGEPRVKEADGSIRKITPLEARLRDLSYVAPIHVEMTVTVNKTEHEPIEVLVGELPIMVKSKFCSLNKLGREELEAIGEDPDDTGGYFIVNGTERALVLIEEIAPNRMILERRDAGNYREAIRVNSEHDGFVQRHIIERKNDGSITISFANITRMPLFLVLKALGMDKDKEILEAIGIETDEIYANLYEIEAKTQGEAVEGVGEHLKIVKKEYRKERVEQILNKYLLPHIGQDPSNKYEKARYLATAIQKILKLSQNQIPQDDLDHYGNKRVRMAGDLLELLFRSILMGKWGLIARLKYNYQKLAKRGKLPTIQTIVEANVVTNQLASAMATGAWVGGRTGVSQRLERANFLRSVSHLRSVISPLTSTQEHFEARELHPTQYGRLCPHETPEGPTIGLRKYLALMAEVTKGLGELEKKKLLSMLKLTDKLEEDSFMVYVDGKPSGFSNASLVDEIKKKRRAGSISQEVNIALYPNLREIRINTDSGRVRRPLIVVEGGRSKLTEEHAEKLKNGELNWSNLTKASVLESLDTEEEDNSLIALNPEGIKEKTTHVEISPMIVLGLSASTIVFPEHNRGDRVNYGAKMSGQAIGLYQSNFFLRTDTKSNMLSYMQKPLVETQASHLVYNDHPSGQNIVLAIMSYDGYNMQDALVMNKASIERGMFRSFFYRLYLAEEKRYWGGQEDVIGAPDKDVRGYRSEEAYKYLAEDGIITPETAVEENDVLVGRTSPLRFLSAESELMTGIGNRRETSSTIRHEERGVVDRVIITENTNGDKLVKVSVRDQRIPEVGDKFASRHGQKGVIGLIVEEGDMPFTSSGIIPDVILNPHSIPSRQTVGQLLELLAGKTAAMQGRPIDASAFSDVRESDLRAILHNLGFRNDGKEVMYSGVNGRKFEVEIFTGVLFYQKLDHMVANKIHARSRGPIALLTKQPTEGRAKEGGLRLGEMEKDCLIAHGAVLTLKERFDSDKTIVPVCKNCGLTAIFNKAKGKNICSVCKDSDIVEVEMSYAFKLLLDEMKTMFVYPKINPAG